LDAGLVGELSEGHFHVVKGLADDEEHYYVRDEKGTSAVLIGRVREPPDIAEANGERNTGHQKLQSVPPLRSLFLPFFLFRPSVDPR